MAEHQTNKSLQLLQTILVSVLLGCTAWLAMAVIQTRDDVIMLKTQETERVILRKIQDEALAKRLDKFEDMQDNTIKTQQEVLRTLIQQKANDAEMVLRLDRLEKNRP